MKKDSDQEIVQDPKIVLGADQNIAYPCVTIIPSANQWTLTGPAWSLRWAAPEVVKGEVDPGLPSDIWSAGWVCWEVAYGSRMRVRQRITDYTNVLFLDYDGQTSLSRRVSGRSPNLEGDSWDSPIHSR